MIAIGIITFIYAPLTVVLPSRSSPDDTPRTSVVQVLSVIFIVLWVTGAVATGIQLFGSSSGNLNAYCTSQVFNHNPYGPTETVKAWILEANYCKHYSSLFFFFIPQIHGSLMRSLQSGNCWRAVFALEIIAITALVLFTIVVFCQDVYDVNVRKYRQETMEDQKERSGRDSSYLEC